MVKLTVTVDDETARLLRKLAERSKKPQSLIFREAIARYHADPPEEFTKPEERARLLGILAEMRAHGDPDKDPDVTRRELDDLRKARRSGGRLHPVD